MNYKYFNYNTFLKNKINLPNKRLFTLPCGIYNFCESRSRSKGQES